MNLPPPRRIDTTWDGYTMVEMAQRLMPVCRTFVDVGAGIKPCEFMLAKRHVVVEPWAQYHDIAKKAVPHIEILNGDWKSQRDAVVMLCPDVIVASDVIEHMDKADGMAFKHDIERMSADGAVVFTPYGFKEQSYKEGEKDSWGYGGTHWQTHRSGWLPEEFEGWHIITGKGEVEPGVWERTFLAILDKTGFMQRPFQQIVMRQ